tara:strand:+ start:414 stop:638 length:225 start_codon:yes stop_codon:yes gene_type:complete
MAFGQLGKHENLDPKNNSNSLYYSVMVKGEGIETLVMTEKEMERIRKRAERNPEDTKMIPSWWDKFIASIAGWF